MAERAYAGGSGGRGGHRARRVAVPASRLATPVPSPAAALQRRVEQAALRGFFDVRETPAWRRNHAGVVIAAALLAVSGLVGWLLLAAA